MALLMSDGLFDKGCAGIFHHQLESYYHALCNATPDQLLDLIFTDKHCYNTSILSMLVALDHPTLVFVGIPVAGQCQGQL